MIKTSNQVRRNSSNAITLTIKCYIRHLTCNRRRFVGLCFAFPTSLLMTRAVQRAADMALSLAELKTARRERLDFQELYLVCML